MTGFDLSAAQETLDREERGQVVELNDEAGNVMYHDGDKPVTVTVVGTYSKRYRRALDTRLGKASRRRRDIEDIQREALEVLAQCVLEWSGFYEAGEPIECTRSNVLRVLTLAPWIREQIEVAMEDHAAFSRASSPS